LVLSRENTTGKILNSVVKIFFVLSTPAHSNTGVKLAFCAFSSARAEKKATARSVPTIREGTGHAKEEDAGLGVPRRFRPA